MSFDTIARVAGAGGVWGVLHQHIVFDDQIWRACSIFAAREGQIESPKEWYVRVMIGVEFEIHA